MDYREVVELLSSYTPILLELLKTENNCVLPHTFQLIYVKRYPGPSRQKKKKKKYRSGIYTIL
jgi:hypothetical protein